MAISSVPRCHASTAVEAQHPKRKIPKLLTIIRETNVFSGLLQAQEVDGVGSFAQPSTIPARRLEPKGWSVCVFLAPRRSCGVVVASHHIPIVTDGAYSRRHQAGGLIIRNIIS